MPIVCDINYSVSMLCFHFKVPHSSFRDSVNFNGYSQRYVYHRVMRFEHCLCAMSLSTLRPFGLIDCDWKAYPAGRVCFLHSLAASPAGRGCFLHSLAAYPPSGTCPAGRE